MINVRKKISFKNFKTEFLKEATPKLNFEGPPLGIFCYQAARFSQVAAPMGERYPLNYFILIFQILTSVLHRYPFLYHQKTDALYLCLF